MKMLLSILLILTAILIHAPRESLSDQNVSGSQAQLIAGPGYRVAGSPPDGPGAAPLRVSSVSSSGMTADEERRYWREPFTGMLFAWVPGGCYEMGCGRWTGECNDDEKPVHEVCLDGFWVGKYEVTQAEWTKVMHHNPSRSRKGDTYPVDNVSWNDVHSFIQKLEAQSGSQHEFRLPTEAEWEYACRSAGRPEKYAGSCDADDVAVYIENSNFSTEPVGSRTPNGLGLHDMSGNVMEWCMDTYNHSAYSFHERTNPVHIGAETWRVCRGGAWDFRAGSVRCAHRCRRDQNYGTDFIGFRLVRGR